MFFILLTIAWFACGFTGAGLMFAYWQRQFPLQAQRNFKQDRISAIIDVIAGPASLLASVVFLSMHKPHGWLWPFSKERINQLDEDHN